MSFFIQDTKMGNNKQRKVKRPPYEELIKQIKNVGYEKVGRKYGVTGNAIKKWVKYYEKYETKHIT